MQRGCPGGDGAGVRTVAAALGMGILLVPVVSGAQPVPISDPPAFVTEVYRHFSASEHGPDYEPPENIYTPRLQALFAADDRRRRGEVGCIDFVFWVDGQDWELKNVQVTSRDVAGHPDRKLVVATFVNLGHAEEIQLDFQKIAGRWLLDDARSVKTDRRWTLSRILKCKL
jgi:hypothetical protein